MATLFNTKIKDTYQSLLKLEDNTILTTTVKNVTDGLGNASPLYMSTTRVGIGTNAPTQTLDIQGGVRINSAGTNVDSSVFIRSYFNAAGGSQIAVPNELRITRSSSILTNQNNVDTTWFFGNYAGNLYLKDQTLNIVGTNVLIGTTTDAGYKLDVNGTVRIQNTLNFNSNFEIASGSVVCGYYRAPGNGPGQVFVENMQAAQIPFQFRSGYGLSASKSFLNTGGRSIFNINIGLGDPNTSNLDASVLLLDGTHNVTSGTGTTIRGIYYNPTITSLTGVVAHRAIETTSGDIVFNGGNVGIGTSSPTNKLEVVGATRISTSLNVGGDGSTGSSFSSGFIAYDTGNGYAHSLVHAQAAQLFLFANPQGFAIAGYEPASSGLSASNLAFMTSSSTRMKILSNGNVLIGTTTDSGYKLDVRGGTALMNRGIFGVSSTGGQSLRVVASTGGGDNVFSVHNEGSSIEYFGITSNTGRVRFDSNWQIGNQLAANNQSLFINSDQATAAFSTLTVRGGNATSGNRGGGNLILSSGASAGSGDGINGYITFNITDTTAAFNTTNSTSEVARFSLAKNLLIGTSTDSGYKLDVNGTARFSSTTIIQSTQFVDSGQIFRSGGNLALQSVAGVGNNNSVCINTSPNDTDAATAILVVKSTTKGFLPPRMTSTQRNAIATPATGLQVYDTTQNAICEYTGTAWRTISGGKQILTATTGATTVDLSLGNVTDVTLSLSTVITLSNPTVGTYVIKLIQDSIGGKTVSWPFNVLWSGSTPPTLTATANKTDVITLVYDGVNYYGTYALNF